MGTEQRERDKQGLSASARRIELFKTQIAVQVNHLNYGNHLGHDSVLTILHEARMQWMATNEMSEISVEGPVGFMITKASVRYKSEAFYGDLLAVTIALASQATRTFGLAYEVKNNRSGKVVAVAETEQIFYDFEKKRVASTPERFRTFIERSCQNACMKIPNVEI